MRGSSGPTPSLLPARTSPIFRSHSFSFPPSPLFLCVCECVDFLTSFYIPRIAGIPGFPATPPSRRPPRVYPLRRGCCACVFPPQTFSLGFLFLSQAPAEPWQLAHSPSVHLSRRPIQLGESPSRAGRGRGRGGAAGAGTPGGPTFPGALFCRGQLQPSGETESGERKQSPLTKPLDESLVGVLVFAFCRKLKSVADKLTIL